MKTLKSFFFGKMNGRFDRYYAGVLHEGAGYPTADEARQDMRAQSAAASTYVGWLR